MDYFRKIVIAPKNSATFYLSGVCFAFRLKFPFKRCALSRMRPKMRNLKNTGVKLDKAWDKLDKPIISAVIDKNKK